MCKIAVGVVGGNAGSRHVANVIVGEWYGERRSCQRLCGRLPPRWRDCHWRADMRERTADIAQLNRQDAKRKEKRKSLTAEAQRTQSFRRGV